RRAGPRGRDRPPRLGHDVPGQAPARRRRPVLGGAPVGPPRARRGLTMLVLGISGSLRAGSFNTALLRAAGALLPPGARLRRYRDLSLVPPYSEDAEAPPPVVALRAAIEAADALVIATPEYNG